MAENFLAEVYHLSRLPFELGAYNVPRVGREYEWSRLVELIDDTRRQKGPKNVVLLGTYGSGKSFLLWQLFLHFRDEPHEVFATRPIRILDPEQGRDIVRNLILRLFKRGVDFDNELIPLVIRAVDNRSATPSYLTPYIDLLIAIADENTRSIARRILHGGRVLKGEAIRMGVPDLQQIKTSEEAIDLLLALQTVAAWAGIEAFVIQIDELEYIDQLAKAQQGRIFDALKELWDRQVAFFSDIAPEAAAPLVLILAATPNFWQEKVGLLQRGSRLGTMVGLNPFFDRIPKANVVELPEGLEPQEARQLVISRMSAARVRGKGKDTIIPFTTDYVEYVFELSHGRPRRIIEICETVVAEAVRRELRQIDKTAAQNILRDLLITYEPVAEPGYEAWARDRVDTHAD